jgi:hypothetical protein
MRWSALCAAGRGWQEEQRGLAAGAGRQGTGDGALLQRDSEREREREREREQARRISSGQVPANGNSRRSRVNHLPPFLPFSAVSFSFSPRYFHYSRRAHSALRLHLVSSHEPRLPLAPPPRPRSHSRSLAGICEAAQSTLSSRDYRKLVVGHFLEDRLLRLR